MYSIIRQRIEGYEGLDDANKMIDFRSKHFMHFLFQFPESASLGEIDGLCPLMAKINRNLGIERKIRLLIHLQALISLPLLKSTNMIKLFTETK